MNKMDINDKEPKFIKEIRRKVSGEAAGRPDAATYEEAGNAALNMVLAHWLGMDSLNPGIVREAAIKEVVVSYERKLQQAANKLANECLAHGNLRKDFERLRLQLGAGKPNADPGKEIRSLQDRVIQLKYDLSILQAANNLGIPMSKKKIRARDMQIQADNLRLHSENRELKKQLAELQNVPSS